MNGRLVVCLFVGTIQLAGCQTTSRQSLVRSAGDHMLARDVYDRLRAEMVRDGGRVGVTASDGVVTLHGVGPDLAARAARIAESVPGVVRVVQDLD